jgi:hypothetical protein
MEEVGSFDYAFRGKEEVKVAERKGRGEGWRGRRLF